MKKLITIVAGMTVVGMLGAFAQGTVLFQNPIPTQYVTLSDGTRPAGNTYSIEVLWGANAGAVNNSLGTKVGFAAAGVFSDGSKTLTGANPGDRPWFVVRAWQNNTGATSYAQAISSGQPIYAGTTTAFQLGAGLGGGSPPLPAPALVGMTPLTLSIVPEPATYALLALGLAGLLIRRRK